MKMSMLSEAPMREWDPSKPTFTRLVSKLPQGTHYFRLLGDGSVGYTGFHIVDGMTTPYRLLRYPHNLDWATAYGDPTQKEKPRKTVGFFAWAYPANGSEGELVYLVFDRYTAWSQLGKLDWPVSGEDSDVTTRDIILTRDTAQNTYTVLLDTRSAACPASAVPGVLEALEAIGAKGRKLSVEGYWSDAATKLISVGTPGTQVLPPYAPVIGAATTPTPTATYAGAGRSALVPASAPNVGFKGQLMHLASVAGLSPAMVTQLAQDHLEDGKLTRDGYHATCVSVAFNATALAFGREAWGSDTTEQAAIDHGFTLIPTTTLDRANQQNWDNPTVAWTTLREALGTPTPSGEYDEIPF